MAILASRGSKLAILGLVCSLLACVAVGVGAVKFLNAADPGSAKTTLVQDKDLSKQEAQRQQKTRSDELKNPLFRTFQGGFANNRDLELEQRDRDLTDQILREADPLLTRVQQENRKGFEALRRPVLTPHKRARPVEPKRIGEDYRL